MFRKLEGDQVMLAMKGKYSVHDLYEWDGKLFARVGGAYVRLKANGTSSLDTQRIVHMEIEEPLFSDKFGRLCTSQRDGYKPVAITNANDDKDTPFQITDQRGS